jgi:predicted CXXCH cytochrome family protein
MNQKIRRRDVVAAGLGLLMVLLLACGESEHAGGDPAAPTRESNGAAAPEPDLSARFVGSQECIGCHAKQGASWRGSDHDRAMEEPTADAVLGRFDGSTLKHFDRTWRFVQEDTGYAIELEEPGQASLHMPVLYTFGVDPLQQYLVARPAGRMQALPVAWDARSEAEGGQRWIDLQPGERTPDDDPLHWDRLAYNWNSQCAVCHSTRLDKAFDAEKGEFDSHWAEIDVGCEACHGPGSNHVARAAMAEAGKGVVGEDSGFDVTFDAWDPVSWQRAPDAPIASRIRPRTNDVELDVCAPCHSRRSMLTAVSEIGAPFLDGHRPSLLDPTLYFEDGQIRDEVYVWGSFLQSRMHEAGVRCSDCHDPHSLELRREDNALCGGCHDRARYETTAHHGHAPGSQGALCVSCHMPERTYMQVDARRDHSFPIPRPDRKASLGVPNACENCHPDRDAAWATMQIDGWRPADATRPSHWSDHLVDGGEARSDSERWLEIALAMELPPIVRANAWSRLANEPEGGPSFEILQARLRDGSDLEQLGLVEVAQRIPPAVRVELLRPLLSDDSKAVRVAAAGALAEVPAAHWRPADRALFARALQEYRGAQQANAERPNAQVNLGLLAIYEGDLERARVTYQKAIEQAPYFVPAYANMADLERMQGRDAESVAWLRRALELSPDTPTVRFALGLALHRTGHAEEALAEFERATKSAPEEPQLTLAWALALDAAGRHAEATEILGEAIDEGRGSGDIRHAIVTLLRDQGQRDRAQQRLAQWLVVSPDDPRARGLAEEFGRRP